MNHDVHPDLQPTKTSLIPTSPPPSQTDTQHSSALPTNQPTTTMPLTTLPNLRSSLKATLEHEDKLLKKYTRLNETLHKLDRIRRRLRASVNAAVSAEYYYNMSRDDLAALRPRIRRLGEERRELLRRVGARIVLARPTSERALQLMGLKIIEMEKEEKFRGAPGDGAEVEAEVEAEAEEEGEGEGDGEDVEDEAQEGKEHHG